MGSRVRGEQGGYGDVGCVALGIHADEATAANVVPNNDGYSTSSLGPKHLLREAAFSTLQEDDLAIDLGTFLQ